MAASGQAHIGILLEQTLGHVSHGRNLRSDLDSTARADLSWREIDFDSARRRDRLPPLSNWTVRSSLAARSAVRSIERQRPLDALFVHTHVPATLLGSTMRRLPTVVSIDATPSQIDSLGGSYQHEVRGDRVEQAKWRLHRRCFQDAAGLITWSQWAADSLAGDYGVDRDLIEVIPPGVDSMLWRRPEPRPRHQGDTVRILFVGGDFTRKGGDVLVEAWRRLQADTEVRDLGLTIELHLVTGADLPPEPNLHVHRGLQPNCPELIDLFHRCDVFALPTRGDCTPVVLAEAATAGLPAVATAVGAIGESIIDGVTGHLIGADPNVEELTARLRPLVIDADQRQRLGQAAAELAANRMDSRKNSERVLDTVLEATRRRSTRRRVVLTVSGVIPAEIDDMTEAGIRPLADYKAIAAATGAELLDWNGARTDESRLQGIIRRAAGNSVAMAYALYRHRHELDVIVTDGEQIGLPLAALLRFHPKRSVRHVMIGHRLTPRKKTAPVRALGLSAGVDEILVYSSAQQEASKRIFSLPEERIRRIDFMVDTKFFQPVRRLDGGPVRDRPLICAAGREFRDYPTLIEAVRDLDVEVVIASASPWSKRADNARSVDYPDHVSITSLNQRELRELLDDCDLLVMPLIDSDFQAGITTILEAMAMERPVVCTATSGQTDVLVDGIHGHFVRPGDPGHLREAILRVLDDRQGARDMGRKGRDLVEERADVRHYANVFADVIASHVGGGPLNDSVITMLDPRRTRRRASGAERRHDQPGPVVPLKPTAE